MHATYMLGQYRTNVSISDWGGQIDPKQAKKWYFLTSLEKLVIGITKNVLEYDIEYQLTPSGDYGFVPTCPRHTSRGGQPHFFSHMAKYLSFFAVFRELKRPKIAHDTKNHFFKVQDIDTPIQPRKKKRQTNVSSALNTFQNQLWRP